MNSQLPHHISTQFDHELEDIRSKVLAMGGLVEQQLHRAIDALAKTDTALAQVVASSDYKVNTFELEIDEECIEILARRNPAASDLRLVISVAKTITDLERIGDETEKIGRAVMRLTEFDNPKSCYLDVIAMGDHVRRLLNASLDAFARLDSMAAVRIARKDSEIDQEYDTALRRLIAYMSADPARIAKVIDVAWIIRAMERIGDHSNNICESTIYLVEGRDVRHTSLDEIEHELASRFTRRDRD